MELKYSAPHQSPRTPPKSGLMPDLNTFEVQSYLRGLEDAGVIMACRFKSAYGRPDETGKDYFLRFELQFELLDENKKRVINNTLTEHYGAREIES